MIEVKNLVKKYGSHMAVDNLSFTVDKGQVLGFLGPNGAGKSTTMNIITGYISATEGSVVINGHDMFEEPEEAKKSIGYLPEIPPLYPDMRVREYLQFVADIKGVKKAKQEKMLKDIMDMTKITDMSQRLIKQLSKGYKQRVGLASAIMGYPELIILDEPTVGLDPKQIIEIRDLIKRLSKNHTIILSSHILSEVSAICDLVMIINKGKLIVSDNPENLSKHMKGSNGIQLKVKAKADQITRILRSIDGVIDIKFLDCLEEGVEALTVYTKEEDDLREAVFYRLAQEQCPIYEMQLIKMSLEDIFLELIKADSNAVELDQDQDNDNIEKEEE